MRAFQFFCGLLMIEGLVVMGLRFYRGATLPEDAVLRFLGRTWTRSEGLQLTETLGAWSCVVGSAGWLLTRFVLRQKERQRNRPKEDS